MLKTFQLSVRFFVLLKIFLCFLRKERNKEKNIYIYFFKTYIQHSSIIKEIEKSTKNVLALTMTKWMNGAYTEKNVVVLHLKFLYSRKDIKQGTKNGKTTERDHLPTFQYFQQGRCQAYLQTRQACRRRDHPTQHDAEKRKARR